MRTPRWPKQLPGFEYAGDDPDGLAPLAGTVACVEGNARSLATFVGEVAEHVVAHLAARA